MEIDDINPLGQCLLFFAGIKEFYYTFEGIGGLTHGRYNNHQTVLRVRQTHYLLYVPNARSILNGSPSELDQSLKMARMMEITDGDLEGAKARVASMIRDVNRCIDVLKDEK